MTATDPTTDGGAKVFSDASQLTKVQKMGIFLLSLAPENAAQILKSLEDDELQVVVAEMAGFGIITQEVQSIVVAELASIALLGARSVAGGIDRTKSILEMGIGQTRASAIFGRISSVPVRVEATQQLADMDARQIFNLIRNEEPQTVALVASYLTVAKTSELLLLMPPEVRGQVVFQMASISSTSPDAFEKIVEILTPKLGNQHASMTNEMGGLKRVGKVLNCLDKVVSKSILIAVQERNSELGQAISQTMFGFDDLASLDKDTLQLILREIDMNDLTVALKAASEKVQSAMLSCLSKRAAEAIREEMQIGGAIKVREIEAAQLRITTAAKQLESEGKVELDRSQGGSSRQKAA